MSRLTFDNDNFRCKIQCGQCDHIKPDGERCRNRVCIGFPTCWIHSKITYGVKVKDSLEVNSEKGLFATRDFETGDWICPYSGELITNQCLEARYPGDRTAPYAVSRASDNLYIDSACVRGIGSMANGRFKRDGFSRNRCLHNAEIVTRRGAGIWLKAIRDIEEGDEIFVYYGDEYRLDLDHNTKRTKKCDTRPC